MNLTITERLILLAELLPKEGDYASLKEVRRAHAALSFTSDELQDLGIKQGEGRVTWNDKGNNYVADIPLSEWITEQIRDALRDLNKKKKLTEREFSVYEKFIVAYDQV